MDVSPTGVILPDENQDNNDTATNDLAATGILGDPLATATDSTQPLNTSVTAAITNMAVVPDQSDISKVNFIKTYTEKYDSEVMRATDAANKILANIDAAIAKRTGEIAIPSEAGEFLDESVEKVEKFDDARVIVRTIMEKAQAAKEESLKAAEEASNIYDEVQAFKKQVRSQIDELRRE